MSAFWWLETLLEHEISYFAFGGQPYRTSCAWYLFSQTLPKYHDVNRAFRLRNDGRGVANVLQDVLDTFKTHRTWPIVIDIDPVAEEQGFREAILTRGALSNQSRYPLYAYASSTPPAAPSSYVQVRQFSPSVDKIARQAWVGLQACDEKTEEDMRFWQAVAEAEVRCLECRFYLAYLEGTPVGACDLFSAKGWGRIDSVITHPDWRRRGVASALVTQAVTDSLALGNKLTYLFTEAGNPAERLYRRLGFELLHPGPLHRYLLLH